MFRHNLNCLAFCLDHNTLTGDTVLQGRTLFDLRQKGFTPSAVAILTESRSSGIKCWYREHMVRHGGNGWQTYISRRFIFRQTELAVGSLPV